MVEGEEITDDAKEKPVEDTEMDVQCLYSLSGVPKYRIPVHIGTRVRVSNWVVLGDVVRLQPR